jgi:hypothetical protein
MSNRDSATIALSKPVTSAKGKNFMIDPSTKKSLPLGVGYLLDLNLDLISFNFVVNDIFCLKILKRQKMVIEGKLPY